MGLIFKEEGHVYESIDEDKQEWDVRGFQNREEINELLATFI